VRIYDVLAKASILLGKLRQAAESAGKEEEVELWRYVREHMFFIFRTGQVYRFEDYRKSLDPARTSLVSPVFAAHEDALSQQAMALLLRTHEEMTEPEQKQLVHILIDLLNFIAETGQHDEFDEHRRTFHEAPPLTLAHFDTREEAEAWLKGLAEPPSSESYILIGDEYYVVWYSREDGVRGLHRDYVMELWLKAFTEKGFPSAIASVNTREEAKQWLKTHPAPPMAFIIIAGEHHLAAYHRRLAHHTLHPLSSLKEWEAEKKRRDEEPEAADEGSASEE
jgi:hypothetical protein